jgi:hypothetical protein
VRQLNACQSVCVEATRARGAVGWCCARPSLHARPSGQRGSFAAARRPGARGRGGTTKGKRARASWRDPGLPVLSAPHRRRAVNCGHACQDARSRGASEFSTGDCNIQSVCSGTQAQVKGGRVRVGQGERGRGLCWAEPGPGCAGLSLQGACTRERHGATPSPCETGVRCAGAWGLVAPRDMAGEGRRIKKRCGQRFTDRLQSTKTEQAQGCCKRGSEDRSPPKQLPERLQECPLQGIAAGTRWHQGPTGPPLPGGGKEEQHPAFATFSDPLPKPFGVQRRRRRRQEQRRRCTRRMGLQEAASSARPRRKACLALRQRAH